MTTQAYQRFNTEKSRRERRKIFNSFAIKAAFLLCIGGWFAIVISIGKVFINQQ